MNINVEVIETKPLTDGHVAFLVRCDGDPASDSWHTYTIDPAMTDAELDAAVAVEIEAHQQRVARLHAARTRVISKIGSFKGKAKKITL